MYSGKEGLILGGSHIVAEKGVYSGRGLDSGRIAHINLLKRRVYSWREG